MEHQWKPDYENPFCHARCAHCGKTYTLDQIAAMRPGDPPPCPGPPASSPPEPWMGPGDYERQLRHERERHR